MLLCWDKIRAETVSRHTESEMKMRTHIPIFCPLLLLLPVLLSGVLGLPDGLHPTPPMGWTSWNTFFENNTEEKMISQVWQLIHDQMLWENTPVMGSSVIYFPP